MRQVKSKFLKGFFLGLFSLGVLLFLNFCSTEEEDDSLVTGESFFDASGNPETLSEIEELATNSNGFNLSYFLSQAEEYEYSYSETISHLETIDSSTAYWENESLGIDSQVDGTTLCELTFQSMVEADTNDTTETDKVSYLDATEGLDFACLAHEIEGVYTEETDLALAQNEKPQLDVKELTVPKWVLGVLAGNSDIDFQFGTAPNGFSICETDCDSTASEAKACMTLVANRIKPEYAIKALRTCHFDGIFKLAWFKEKAEIKTIIDDLEETGLTHNDYFRVETTSANSTNNRLYWQASEVVTDGTLVSDISRALGNFELATDTDDNPVVVNNWNDNDLVSPSQAGAYALLYNGSFGNSALDGFVPYSFASINDLDETTAYTDDEVKVLTAVWNTVARGTTRWTFSDIKDGFNSVWVNVTVNGDGDLTVVVDGLLEDINNNGTSGSHQIDLIAGTVGNLVEDGAKLSLGETLVELSQDVTLEGLSFTKVLGSGAGSMAIDPITGTAAVPIEKYNPDWTDYYRGDVWFYLEDSDGGNVFISSLQASAVFSLLEDADKFKFLQSCPPKSISCTVDADNPITGSDVESLIARGFWSRDLEFQYQDTDSIARITALDFAQSSGTATLADWSDFSGASVGVQNNSLTFDLSLDYSGTQNWWHRMTGVTDPDGEDFGSTTPTIDGEAVSSPTVYSGLEGATAQASLAQVLCVNEIKVWDDNEQDACASVGVLADLESLGVTNPPLLSDLQVCYTQIAELTEPKLGDLIRISDDCAVDLKYLLHFLANDDIDLEVRTGTLSPDSLDLISNLIELKPDLKKDDINRSIDHAEECASTQPNNCENIPEENREEFDSFVLLDFAGSNLINPGTLGNLSRTDQNKIYLTLSSTTSDNPAFIRVEDLVDLAGEHNVSKDTAWSAAKDFVAGAPGTKFIDDFDVTYPALDGLQLSSSLVWKDPDKAFGVLGSQTLDQAAWSVISADILGGEDLSALDENLNGLIKDQTPKDSSETFGFSYNVKGGTLDKFQFATKIAYEAGVDLGVKQAGGNTVTLSGSSANDLAIAMDTADLDESTVVFVLGSLNTPGDDTVRVDFGEWPKNRGLSGLDFDDADTFVSNVYRATENYGGAQLFYRVMDGFGSSDTRYRYRVANAVNDSWTHSKRGDEAFNLWTLTTDLAKLKIESLDVIKAVDGSGIRSVVVGGGKQLSDEVIDNLNENCQTAGADCEEDFGIVGELWDSPSDGGNGYWLQVSDDFTWNVDDLGDYAPSGWAFNNGDSLVLVIDYPSDSDASSEDLATGTCSEDSDCSSNFSCNSGECNTSCVEAGDDCADGYDCQLFQNNYSCELTDYSCYPEYTDGGDLKPYDDVDYLCNNTDYATSLTLCTNSPYDSLFDLVTACNSEDLCGGIVYDPSSGTSGAYLPLVVSFQSTSDYLGEGYHVYPQASAGDTGCQCLTDADCQNNQTCTEEAGITSCQ